MSQQFAYAYEARQNRIHDNFIIVDYSGGSLVYSFHGVLLPNNNRATSEPTELDRQPEENQDERHPYHFPLRRASTARAFKMALTASTTALSLF